VSPTPRRSLRNVSTRGASIRSGPKAISNGAHGALAPKGFSQASIPKDLRSPQPRKASVPPRPRKVSGVRDEHVTSLSYGDRRLELSTHHSAPEGVAALPGHSIPERISSPETTERCPERVPKDSPDASIEVPKNLTVACLGHPGLHPEGFHLGPVTIHTTGRRRWLLACLTGSILPDGIPLPRLGACRNRLTH
jgi:hypothetical protein